MNHEIESILEQEPHLLHIKNVLPENSTEPHTLISRNTPEAQQLTKDYIQNTFSDWKNPNLNIISSNIRVDDLDTPSYLLKWKRQKGYKPQAEYEFKEKFRYSSSALNEFTVAALVEKSISEDPRFSECAQIFGFKGLKSVSPILATIQPQKTAIGVVYPYINGNNLYKAKSQSLAENALTINRQLIKLFLEHHILPFDLKPKQLISGTDGYLHLCDMEQYIPDQRNFFIKKYFGENKEKAIRSIMRQG